jgi:5,10-methylenetetrahydromethanopterin reductase
MKFGFGTKPSEHYKDFVDLVRDAEGLGYDFAWVPDQTFYRDPFMVLAAMALGTERINIGVGVTNPYTRHPAMVARSMATLAEMAPGRAYLGIGAGNRKELLSPLGYDGAHAAPMCREMTELVRAFLSGAVVEHQGQHFKASGVKLDFAVPQNVPCYIAGRGPHVLHAAGEVADGAIIGGLCTPAGIAYALQQVEMGAQRVGRQLGDIDIVAWVTCRVTDDRPAVLRELRPVIAHLVGGAPMEVLSAIRLDMDTVRAIKEVYAAQGISEAAPLVTDECVEAFTLVGNGPELVERIQALEGAGVNQIATLMPPGNAAQHGAVLRSFAQAVMQAMPAAQRQG